MREVKSVVMVSNYFNHHQKPFSDEMISLIGDGYSFIATQPMEEERKNLGWDLVLPSYVHCSYIDKSNYEKCMRLINTADVVIFGSAPEAMILKRISDRKLIFRYSERLLRNGTELLKYPIRFFRYHKYNPIKSQNYLLCSSAYTAADYSKFGMFKNRSYKWGYFTEAKEYPNIDLLLENKQPASLLWVARFLELKHPEYVIDTAERLKKDGYKFSIDMIGNGTLESEIKEKVKQKGLSDCINFLGSMKPEEVRKHMEQSQIFLFTSDFHEGWGAVLNEAMNSGCAVISSHAIGAAPFLIDDGTNGLIFENGNVDDLYEKVKRILDHPEEGKLFGKKAYYTIKNLWSPKEAAERLIKLSYNILNALPMDEYKDGPCSKANILSNNWYNQRASKGL